MMEFLYELRSFKSDFCRLFDFFEDANTAKAELIEQGKFPFDDLYIANVVSE